MLFRHAMVTTIWISILCHHVDSFLPVSLKVNFRGPSFSSFEESSASQMGIKTGSKVVFQQDRREYYVSKSRETTSVASSSRTHRVDFVSPLLDYGYPPAARDLELRQRNEMGEKEKPILLYLPGFDGTYVCPFIQFPELGTEFEVACMTIGMDDRSTYKELKTMVLDFLETNIESASSSDSTSDEEKTTQKKDTPTDGNGFFGGIFGGNAKKMERKEVGRPVYIAGESFGGILASDVALTLLEEQKKGKNPDGADINLQGLVLINPATCYDRSQLATAGPPVANTPIPFYLISLFSKLVPLFTDEFSVEQLFLILQAKALPSVIDNPPREAYMGRVALSLPTKLEFMPPSTLSWRLNEWLQTGCAALGDSSFASFPGFRSLIVVGEKDKTLPSIAEAERLANKVMNPSKTKIHVVDGAGHASTCGSRLDLTAVIRKCFPELQNPPDVTRWKNNSRASDNAYAKRTSMKPEAIQGVGPNFGMEERYDKADIGLNPLLYWSKSNYKSVQRKTEERRIEIPSSEDTIRYKKSIYTVSD